MQEIFYDPESLGVTLEGLYEHYKDPPNHSAAWTLMWVIRHMNYEKLVEQLEAVTPPTLIIHGKEDRWIPPCYAQQLNQRLPHSRLIEVPQTCHSPELEKVTLTYHHIVNFLQEEVT
jgi:pimeloyl-ACP methyl ester carboxylesterase